MINELTELNRLLTNRIQHIIKVVEKYDESTDYEELECINVDLGDIMSCQLLDASGNMARISIEGKHYWHPSTTKEFTWPIDMLENWNDDQIIAWFKEENERLFDKELKSSYKNLLNAINCQPLMVKELLDAECPENQFEALKRHVCEK